MQLSPTFLTDLLVTFVGIFIGTLFATSIEKRNVRRRKRERAVIILRSLEHELMQNFTTFKNVYTAYKDTPWGKSFYVSVIGWETALASGDSPDIIGFELADVVRVQYALLIRIRYYVDLMTQIWLAPTDIEGYEQIREGFRLAILNTMAEVIKRHPMVLRQIRDMLEEQEE